MKKRWTDDWIVSEEYPGFMERVCTQYIYSMSLYEIYYANENDPRQWTYIVKPELASTYSDWFKNGMIVAGSLHKVRMIDPINHKRGDSIIWVDCQPIVAKEEVL